MVRIQNVSIVYKSGNKRIDAVKNVSLDINEKDIFGIVGSSGAGKSSLLRTINLLERPSSGKILINNMDITSFKGESLRKIRHKIGFVFQHFNLFNSKSVYDNVAFPMKIAGKDKNEISNRVLGLLDLVGLSDKADVLPSKLSGGQKQRVGIARALANNPQVLLCDEPTSALDLETTQSILELIKEINLKLGITVIIISHEMDVIKKICTRVAVMSSGSVIEENTSYNIFAKPKFSVTKEFVRHSLNLEVPEKLLKGISGTVLKIIYRGESALKPVLSEAVRNFPVNINILHGKIEYIAEMPIGIMIINITGSLENIESAKKYFDSQTAGMEVIYE
ncbi:MAG: ATP-binding cassette domain-containing protein [Spirochaetes bacterium]|nr:ATP-binding cassette domain-containing protein [Spirochaetota bacterium]